jgi:hypothetical protein
MHEKIVKIRPIIFIIDEMVIFLKPKMRVKAHFTSARQVQRHIFMNMKNADYDFLFNCIFCHFIL